MPALKWAGSLRRRIVPVLDLTSAGFTTIVVAGFWLAPRVPDRTMTDQAWLGCRKSLGWGIRVDCTSSPVGHLIAFTVEASDRLALFPRALLWGLMGAVPISGASLAVLACITALELFLILWIMGRALRLVRHTLQMRSL